MEDLKLSLCYMFLNKKKKYTLYTLKNIFELKLTL